MMRAAEWVRKAEDDYFAAEQLLRGRRHANHDAVCFHAQQCAEKYFKAFLERRGREIPRTHDLLALLGDIGGIEPMWEALREPARLLTDYAVRYRYPGSSADRSMALEAARACRLVRNALRSCLELPSPRTGGVPPKSRRSPGSKRKRPRRRA